LLRYKTQYSMAGLVIVLLGVPVYFIWSRQSKKQAASTISVT